MGGLGRANQLGAKLSDLRLETLRVVHTVLNLRPLLLFHQFNDLQLDAHGMIRGLKIDFLILDALHSWRRTHVWSRALALAGHDPVSGC
jgi:hypothetical protein